MLSELLINGSGRAHMLPVCPKHDLTLEHFDFTRDCHEMQGRKVLSFVSFMKAKQEKQELPN